MLCRDIHKHRMDLCIQSISIYTLTKFCDRIVHTFFRSSSETLTRGVISWTSWTGSGGKLAGRVMPPASEGGFLKVHLSM